LPSRSTPDQGNFRVKREISGSKERRPAGGRALRVSRKIGLTLSWGRALSHQVFPVEPSVSFLIIHGVRDRRRGVRTVHSGIEKKGGDGRQRGQSNDWNMPSFASDQIGPPVNWALLRPCLPVSVMPPPKVSFSAHDFCKMRSGSGSTCEQALWITLRTLRASHLPSIQQLTSMSRARSGGSRTTNYYLDGHISLPGWGHLTLNPGA
jgi:hypothetical protein